MEKPAPPGQFPSKGVMPRTGTIGNSAHEGASWQSIGLTGAFYVGLLDGLLDGLLGVAGMMKLIVSQWIIPENSLRLAKHQFLWKLMEIQC